jgi:RNAse (barnase) inhibitor barstar
LFLDDLEPKKTTGGNQMMKKRIIFQTPIPSKFKEDLEKKIFYISELISDFNLSISNGKIDGIDVVISGAKGDIEDIERKIKLTVDKQFSNRVSFPIERVWSNEKKKKYNSDMFAILQRENEAFEMGDGLVGLGEMYISLFNYFDFEISSLVKKKFGAREYRYPTLISTSAMKRSHYLDFFPHFIMFVTRLHSDIDVYKDFMEKSKKNEGLDYINYCKDTEYCLAPTMCYHTYHQFSNSKLPMEENFVVTSRGKSFRFESKYQKNLERLWDFTIREIVFVGSLEFVKKSRKRFMEEIFVLFDQLDLFGFCETASDPFFGDLGENNFDNRISQTVMKLKYELRLNINNEKTIAVSSFNLHNDFLGRTFNIRFEDDNYVKTACAGFGLERLVYAFLCQHGLDQKKWPSRIKKYLLKKKELEQ